MADDVALHEVEDDVGDTRSAQRVGIPTTLFVGTAVILLVLARRKVRTRHAERASADAGVALVDLFASTGESLSYWQDAAAGEAHLEPCTPTT